MVHDKDMDNLYKKLPQDCQWYITNMIKKEEYTVAHKLAVVVYSDPNKELEKWKLISKLFPIPTPYLGLRVKRSRDALCQFSFQFSFELPDDWYDDFETLEEYLRCYLKDANLKYLSCFLKDANRA